MLFIYSILIFFIISFISYKILIFINVKTYLSYFAVSVIFSLLITKIIHYNFFYDKSHSNNNSNKLIVGISPDYPPYAYIKDNKIVGFDIDLLELIAEELNLKLELVSMPFHSILVSLQLNNITMAASGLSGSKERAKYVLISDPYFKNDYLSAVSLKENSFNSIELLKNKKIIINTGYISENYIKNTSLTNNILQLKSVPDGLLGLSLKQGDAFITSNTSLIELAKTKEFDKYFIFPLSDNIENEEMVSFLINRNNPELLNDINDTITKLNKNNSISNLIKKWHMT